ncbi:MAG: hypothetical protein U5L72_17575 [Bacteroidales bacterium]|nr:hypothetical protein [Bacteroidales bacterium]
MMKAPLIPGGTYSLVCMGGSFRDIYGNVTDSTNYRFAVATEEDYGSIRAKLSGYAGNVIVQLLAEKEKVVREEYVRSPGDITFPLLDKGRYRLKAIYDLDSRYGMGRQATSAFSEIPEPVSCFPGELEVKINWGAGTRTGIWVNVQ